VTRWLPLLLFLCLHTQVGCHREVPVKKSTENAQKPKEDGAPAQIAYTTTVEEMGEEFLDNKVAAEEKYNDRIIDLTGRVASVNARNEFYFQRVHKQDKGSLEIFCHLLARFEPRVERLSPGQKVKVVGRLLNTGMLTLTDCSLTELDTAPMPVMPAEQMAKEFEQNWDAAHAKFAGRDIIVSGMVTDLPMLEGSYQATLAGTGKVRVVVTMLGKQESEQLKKGQSVELRGGAVSSDQEKHEIYVQRGFLLRAKQ
jgi:hypothetical protein